MEKRIKPEINMDPKHLALIIIISLFFVIACTTPQKMEQKVITQYQCSDGSVKSSLKECSKEVIIKTNVKELTTEVTKFQCADGIVVTSIEDCQPQKNVESSVINKDEQLKSKKETMPMNEKNVQISESDDDCPRFDGMDVSELNPVFVTDQWGDKNSLGHINIGAKVDDEGRAINTNRWSEFLNKFDFKGYTIKEANYNCFSQKGKIGFNPHYNYCIVLITKETYDDSGVLIDKKKQMLVIVLERFGEFKRESTSIGGELRNMYELTAANIKYIKSYCMNLQVGVKP